MPYVLRNPIEENASLHILYFILQLIVNYAFCLHADIIV